jgi:hypothetical protein
MTGPVTITDAAALQRVIEHREIFHDEMLALMRRIMGGEMSPVMMAALLIGLRAKKETIGEITAAAQVMREFSTKVEARIPSTFRPARCSWRQLPARGYPSTATAAYPASRAALMCSRRWA